MSPREVGFQLKFLQQEVVSLYQKKSNFAAQTTSMLWISKRKTRIAAIPLLLLLLVPWFGLVFERTPPLDLDTKVSAHPGWFNFSTFLKDGEEKEKEEVFPMSYSLPLLDLSNHILNLQVTHQIRNTTLLHEVRITQRQPFTILCTLLI